MTAIRNHIRELCRQRKDALRRGRGAAAYRLRVRIEALRGLLARA